MERKGVSDSVRFCKGCRFSRKFVKVFLRIYALISFRRYIKPLENIEIIAKRFGIRELNNLRKNFGGENWRKLKGNAYVELTDGQIRYAELHWYECHGIGKRKMKVKRLFD